MFKGLRLARLAGEAAKQQPPRDVAQLTRSFAGLQSSALSASIARRCFVAPVKRVLPRSFRTFATISAAESSKKSTTTRSGRNPTRARAKTSRRAAAKKTTKPKRKAAPKKPVRRVLSAKQKEAQEVKKRREHVKKLKETALFAKEPPLKPQTAWTAFVHEKMAGVDGKSMRISDMMKKTAAEFKALSPSELETYNHTASQNKAANEAAYRAWVESHKPEAIRQANAARQTLVRMFGKQDGTKRKKSGRGYKTIKDERRVKRPTSAYFHFNIEKQTNGDLKGMTISQRAQLVKQDWAALSQTEKKKYEDLAAADLSRYQREFQSTYGHAPNA